MKPYLIGTYCVKYSAKHQCQIPTALPIHSYKNTHVHLTFVYSAVLTARSLEQVDSFRLV